MMPSSVVVRRWGLWAVRAAVGVVLVVYLVKAGGAWPSFASRPDALWLIVAVNLISLLGAATEARRMAVLMGAQKVPVSFSRAFRLVCIATLFNLWIPGGTGGDLTKLYYLAGRNRGRGIEVATILVVDRAVALFALLVLILTLLAVGPPMVTAAPIVSGLALASVVAMALLTAGTLAAWSKTIRSSRMYRALIAQPFFGSYLGRAADAAYAFRDLKSAILAAGVWSLVGHLLLAASFALAASVLLPSVSPVAASTLSLLGLVANVLPVTPGGIGVGEAATEVLFRSIGAPGGAILIVIWRLGTATICAFGAIFFFWDPVVSRVASTEAAQ
jgi:glycosyltransferase 2 family protein